MTAVDVMFFVLSACAVWSGWRVFRVNSMIRATFLLLISFMSVGGIGLLLSAPYIGVVTVFMMAVEMMVMGLFMVMFMMNPAGLNPMQMVHQHRLSVASGVMAFLAMTAAVLLSDLPYNPVAPDRPVVRDLGVELLGNSMLIFETAGVTLLATMLGAVILSSRTGRFGRADEGAQPPTLNPGGAPAGRVPKKGGGHGHHGHHGHDHDDGDAQGDHNGHEGHGSDGGHEGHSGQAEHGDPDAGPSEPGGDEPHKTHRGKDQET